MKFIELQSRTTKIMKNLIIQRHNHENHEIPRIPCQGNEDHESLIIPHQNIENH